MVLVHYHRDIWVGFNSRQDQVAQEIFTCILAGTAGGLQNYWAIGFMGCLHDRLHLLQIVHIERWDAVAIFSSVI